MMQFMSLFMDCILFWFKIIEPTQLTNSVLIYKLRFYYVYSST